MPRKSRAISHSEDEEENFDPNEMEGQEEEEQESPSKVTRSKRGQKQDSSKAPAFDPSDSRPGRKRVLIAEEKIVNSKSSPSLIQLRHPGTGKAALFLIDAEVKVIRELLTFKEENRSWFIDDTVESDGKMYFSCQFDPFLLLLPFLCDPTAKMTPLDQLVDDPEFPAIKKIAGSEPLTKKMNKIADQKGPADLNVWKYNEEKTLEYLGSKVTRVSKHLRKSGVNIQGGSISGNFVKSGKEEADEGQYLRYAFGMVSSYLSAEIKGKLKTHLKIPDEQVVKKREPSEKLASASKKAKTTSNPNTPTEDYSKNYKKVTAKETALNAKQKALARSASGSKSITGFFTKK